MNWKETCEEITELAMETFGTGRTVVYKPGSGGSVSISGILLREWMDVKTGIGTPVSGFHTVLDIALADILPAVPSRGDKAVVDGVEFKVIDSQEDGGGGSRLVLSK